MLPESEHGQMEGYNLRSRRVLGNFGKRQKQRTNIHVFIVDTIVLISAGMSLIQVVLYCL